MINSRRRFVIETLAWCGSIPLAGCEEPAISTTDVLGTYRATVPAGQAIIELKGNGSWQYRIEGPSPFQRGGRWAQEPKLSTPSSIVIALNHFDLGFTLNEGDPGGPSYRLFTFEKVYRGRVRTCITDLDAKYWGPKGQICFEQM